LLEAPGVPKKKAPLTQNLFCHGIIIDGEGSGLGHRLQALHAQFDALGSSVDYGTDGPQIWIINSKIHVVGMRDGLAGLRMLTANFTGFCHGFPPKSVYFAFEPV
jgi:hypothetical protein